MSRCLSACSACLALARAWLRPPDAVNVTTKPDQFPGRARHHVPPGFVPFTPTLPRARLLGIGALTNPSAGHFPALGASVPTTSGSIAASQRARGGSSLLRQARDAGGAQHALSSRAR